jgi:hypothetical protein
MRAIANAVSAAVLFGAVTGCSRPPDYLYVDPRAQPVRVELRKSFGTINPHYAPVPISECVFYEVGMPADGDVPSYPQEMWRVLSVAPDRPVLDLRYGVLPPGFLQATPSREAAPPLEPGHHYTVECNGDTIATSEFILPEVVTRPAPPLRKRPEPARQRSRESSRTTPPQADPRTSGSRP